jgi:hypothetical protein
MVLMIEIFSIFPSFLVFLEADVESSKVQLKISAEISELQEVVASNEILPSSSIRCQIHMDRFFRSVNSSLGCIT